MNTTLFLLVLMIAVASITGCAAGQDSPSDERDPADSMLGSAASRLEGEDGNPIGDEDVSSDLGSSTKKGGNDLGRGGSSSGSSGFNRNGGSSGGTGPTTEIESGRQSDAELEEERQKRVRDNLQRILDIIREQNPNVHN